MKHTECKGPDRPVSKGDAKMKVLGITGGIGSGKTIVLELMREYFGAEVIMCDEIGRKLQQRGEECYAPIVELFGPEALGPDGELNRPWIAGVISASPELKAKLEAIVHPAVKREVLQRISQIRKEGTASLIVVESALLLENHYEEICDEIWYVYAREDVRRERLKAYRGYDDERIDHILRIQPDPESYAARCSRRLENNTDGTQELLKQIEEGLNGPTVLAARAHSSRGG